MTAKEKKQCLRQLEAIAASITQDTARLSELWKPLEDSGIEQDFLVSFVMAFDRMNQAQEGMLGLVQALKDRRPPKARKEAL